MSASDGGTPVVNGLALPPALAEALRTGRWAPPGDPDALLRVFGERPNDTLFYSPEQMDRQNQGWADETDEAYLGSPDPDRPPGDVDPARSVLIADLGAERLVALDYRTAGEPAVVYLGITSPRWVQVASSVGELIERLGL